MRSFCGIWMPKARVPRVRFTTAIGRFGAYALPITAAHARHNGMLRFAFLSAALLAISASPAHARDYGNVGGWDLASFEDGCGLYANQSASGEIIILKRLDGTVHIQVSNDRWNTDADGEITFTVDGKVWGGDYAVARTSEADSQGYVGAFAPSVTSVLRAGSQLAVQRGAITMGRFSLNGSAIALNRIENCLADLRRDGPDSRQDAIAIPTKAKPATPLTATGKWFDMTDYPRAAQNEGRAGTVVFVLTVGKDGRATDCKIDQSSGHSDIDASTCQAAKKRAKFNPALDANGNKIEGSYRNRVTWSVPK